MFKVYCASGWFNKEQLEAYNKIHLILDMFCDNISVFYPKEHADIKDIKNITKEEKHKIFEDNLEAIKNSDFVVVSTEGKDMGTLFESGFSYCLNKPIIYCCFSLGNNLFNVMLSESSLAVAKTPVVLINILNRIITKGLEKSNFSEFEINNKAE